MLSMFALMVCFQLKNAEFIVDSIERAATVVGETVSSAVGGVADGIQQRWDHSAEANPQSITWLYEDGSFIPIAKLTSDAAYSIVTDHIGTPTAMLDHYASRVWDKTFDIWGQGHQQAQTKIVGGASIVTTKLKGSNESVELPFRFQGQYVDAETGLYYNCFRYYMPDEGIYTQRDPIGLAGGNPTLYGYVHDTNVETDPFGLQNYRNLSDIELENKIWEIAYRNKKNFRNSGTHGVIHRIREQITGSLRPPDPGWKTHDDHIKSALKNLRAALNEARRRGVLYDKIKRKFPNMSKIASLSPPKPTDTDVPGLCQ